MTTPDRTPESSETDARPRVVFRWLHALVLDGDPRVRSLGTFASAYAEHGAAIARSIRHSVWHMTVAPSWSAVRTATPLGGAHQLHKGVEMRYVTTPLGLRRLPLLSSHHHPYLRVGPVVESVLIVDGGRIFFAGPTGTPAAADVWESSDPRVVAAAMRAFDATWREAEPAHEPHEEPPFTRRMVTIGFHLTEGASDREIARALGVSERTVSAEVAEIVRRLGARSRAHAIAVISGANL